MKKLLAVLCFVPVGLVVLAFIYTLLVGIGMLVHLLLTNPLSFLKAIGIFAGLMLAFAAFYYYIPKLTELGARLWRGR